MVLCEVSQQLLEALPGGLAGQPGRASGAARAAPVPQRRPTGRSLRCQAEKRPPIRWAKGLCSDAGLRCRGGLLIQTL
eukprot:scaffold50739_cov40-Prasinocladus_malaysianus.AAC.1